MSTGLFADEENGYNEVYDKQLDEIKYTLKGSAHSTNTTPAPAATAPEEDFGDEELDFGGKEDGLDGLEDAPADDKPFDDEPFDAGIEADEESDPKKYIEQLSGKLGQSLRDYSETEGQPDFDLEKFAINSVISATHTSDMDDEDKADIIDKIEGAGDEPSDNPEGDELDAEMSAEPEEDSIPLGAGDEPVEEVEELPFGGIEPMTTEPLVAAIDEPMPIPTGNIGQEDGYNHSGQPADISGAADLVNLVNDTEEVPEPINAGAKDLKDMVNDVNEDMDLPSFKHNPNDFAQDDLKRYYDATVTRNKDGLTGKVIRFGSGKLKVKITDGKHIGKIYYATPSEITMMETEVKESIGSHFGNDENFGKDETSNFVAESEKKGIFVDKDKLIEKLRLMENAEPMIEPQVVPKTPVVKPNTPQREIDRPFNPPKRKTKIRPKAEN